MRIGTSIWPGYELLFVAKERGYFGETSVKVVDFTSTTESSRALRNGALDAAALTLDEAIKLAQAGMDIKVILVIDYSNGADVVLARPEFAGLEDLKHKRVGLETSSIGDYVLTRALETAGMKVSDIQPVAIDISEQERAYKEGRVDAVVTYEPVRTKLLAAGARNLFDSSKIPGEVVDVLIARTEFLKRGEAQVKDVLTGWFRAFENLQTERENTIRIMAKRESIAEIDFAASLEGLKIPDLEENRKSLGGPTPSLLVSARRLAAIMRERNLIDGDPDMTSVIDGTWVAGMLP